MTAERKSASRSLRWYEKCLVRLLSWLLRGWWRTLRIRYEADFVEFCRQKNPLVIIFWHEHLFIAADLYRRFRQNQRLFGLVSASKDGAWLAYLLHVLGIGAVRGSSNRGGMAAFRESISHIEFGDDIVITPDGPRGPRHQLKPGAIRLSLRGNAPILALKIRHSWAKSLRSWDAFRLPLPFSKIQIHCALISPDQLRQIDCQNRQSFLEEKLSFENQK